jgi:hypothetical protein
MASKNKTFGNVNWRLCSQLLMSASVISILLAGIGYLGIDIWLASTQWLIVATVLAIFGVYARLESH